MDLLSRFKKRHQPLNGRFLATHEDGHREAVNVERRLERAFQRQHGLSSRQMRRLRKLERREAIAAVQEVTGETPT